MMRWLCVCLLVGFILHGTANAEKRPDPGPGDSRIQSVLYDPDDVVLLEMAPGYQVTVQFAPDERIENVAVGDSNAWQVTPNRRGDNLFVKLVQQGVSTDMVVVTDARVYSFALAPLYTPHSLMPFVVRFRYPPAATAAAILTEDQPLPVQGRWRLSGNGALRPSRIEDDGTHIAIAWTESVSLPAIFSVDAQGREALVNGMMRNGVFVIDGIVDRLVFRLDKQSAAARRIPVRKRK